MTQEEAMEKLEGSIGKQVKVLYVLFGKPREDEGILKNVRSFINIEIEQTREGAKMPLSTFIPFVDSHHAVREIRENGTILYKNTLISPNHNLKDNEDLFAMTALSFGDEIAERLCPKRKAKTKTKG